MLVARNYQPRNLVRLLPEQNRANVERSQESQRSTDYRSARPDEYRLPDGFEAPAGQDPPLSPELNSQTNYLLYLFACQVEWEKRADAGSGWEVIAAARDSNQYIRAHACCLLDRSERLPSQTPDFFTEQDGGSLATEVGKRTPNGLEIIESCMTCKVHREGFFCRFSPSVLRPVDEASHHTVMPAEAVLFVEGQAPRGIFVVCSGVVKLFTTSKEGKVLILKQAKAGDVLGLSAAISRTNYEMTAETASACQLNFIGRQDLIRILHGQSEMGAHAALWLSREFQGAYRDIHDLVLARSSSGKLARLLLSCVPAEVSESRELHLRSAMTHEEMAQRIGSSRETVTRLLSELKKKRLIRHDGATLVIRDRMALQALAQ